MRTAKGPSPPQGTPRSPCVDLEGSRGFGEDWLLKEQGLPGEEFCNPVDLGVVGGGPETLWENYRPRAGLRLLKAPRYGKT